MEMINALEAAEKYNLYLKIVTVVRNFDSYNSFYNIYDVNEEPVKRLAILTSNKQLEEVYDNMQEITEPIVIDGDVWIKEYSLLDDPKKIDLSILKISSDLIKK